MAVFNYILPLSLRSYSPTNSSATLGNAIERPSIKLKISSGTSSPNILNSVVVDEALAKSLLLHHRKQFEMRHLVSCWDDVEVATVEWESAWELGTAMPKSSILGVAFAYFTHGDAPLAWIGLPQSGHVKTGIFSQRDAASRPGPALAQWQIKSHTDEYASGVYLREATG
ncbi:hypothetical protein BJV74DRAFT_888665 [Russula compacta]|nr:hypothetical protein BJV74DRAFT_888665 [Russula compacta]